MASFFFSYILEKTRPTDPDVVAKLKAVIQATADKEIEYLNANAYPVGTPLNLSWCRQEYTAMNRSRHFVLASAVHHDLESVTNTIACGGTVQFTSSGVVPTGKSDTASSFPSSSGFPSNLSLLITTPLAFAA